MVVLVFGVQVPLVVAVPSVIAALGANLGDVVVVSTSLTILQFLAAKDGNQVQLVLFAARSGVF